MTRHGRFVVHSRQAQLKEATEAPATVDLRFSELKSLASVDCNATRCVDVSHNQLKELHGLPRVLAEIRVASNFITKISLSGFTNLRVRILRAQLSCASCGAILHWLTLATRCQHSPVGTSHPTGQRGILATCSSLPPHT